MKNVRNIFVGVIVLVTAAFTINGCKSLPAKNNIFWQGDSNQSNVLEQRLFGTIEQPFFEIGVVPIKIDGQPMTINAFFSEADYQEGLNALAEVGAGRKVGVSIRPIFTDNGLKYRIEYIYFTGQKITRNRSEVQYPIDGNRPYQFNPVTTKRTSTMGRGNTTSQTRVTYQPISFPNTPATPAGVTINGSVNAPLTIIVGGNGNNANTTAVPGGGQGGVILRTLPQDNGCFLQGSPQQQIAPRDTCEMQTKHNKSVIS